MDNASNPMATFYTRERANAGVRIPLFTPEGRKTDHWLELRGIDSDEFRLADVQAKREAVRLAAINDTKERDEAIYELTTRLTAILVTGWSFDHPCTQENVIAFFKEAPQIMNAVDLTAGDRGYFFRVGSNNSSDTPVTNSSSTKSRKGRSKASATP